MANEITATQTLSASKSGVTVTGSVTSTIDLSGVGIYSSIVSIGTSDEALSFPGDLTTEGITWIWIKNLDATNFVELSLATGGSFDASRFAKISPGQAMLWKVWTGNPTIYAQADTAECNIQLAAVGT